MSLSAGDVFWLVNPEVPTPVSHPHIVIEVSTEKKVHFVFATTDRRRVEYMCKRAEGKKEAKHLHTMVVTDSAECAILTQPSYINANMSYSRDEYVLVKLPTFSYCPNVKIADSLMKKLVVALLSSNPTSEQLRAMLLQRIGSP